MNRIEGEEDEDYNLSSKYVTFDENGRPIEDGCNSPENTGNNPAAPVAYSVINISSSKTNGDEKYVTIANSSSGGEKQVAHNIVGSGVAYAIPNRKANDEHIVTEDDEKYQRLDNIESQTRRDIPCQAVSDAVHKNYENPFEELAQFNGA